MISNNIECFCFMWYIMGYWVSVRSRWLAKFFFSVCMDQDGVKVHKLAEKEGGQYPAILTEQTWSIKDIIIWPSGNVFLVEHSR